MICAANKIADSYLLATAAHRLICAYAGLKTIGSLTSPRVSRSQYCQKYSPGYDRLQEALTSRWEMSDVLTWNSRACDIMYIKREFRGDYLSFSFSLSRGTVKQFLWFFKFSNSANFNISCFLSHMKVKHFLKFIKIHIRIRYERY